MNKKEIKLQINAGMFVSLNSLVTNHISKLLDKVDKCRAMGAHSCANQYIAEIDDWMELDEELNRVYDENFSE